MRETLPINRPPAFNLESIWPSSPRVRINTACREEHNRTEFWAEIIELDIDQELTAIWFWNYDAAAEHPDSVRPRREQPVPVNGTIYRTVPSYMLPSPVPDSDLDAEGAHTLEVFVAETYALLRGTGSKRPYYRNLRDCAEEGYPADCISTHPAVMRWTVDNYSSPGQCPE